ncbi:uncharacterized protein VTP21DRAFT_8743 [Calcarisporiella thermophila]|uniref:uncharacterized protein n=1 Tax=Calcarisporiella thermophila TaxID=911321 RepID=UPI003743DEE5
MSRQPNGAESGSDTANSLSQEKPQLIKEEDGTYPTEEERKVPLKFKILALLCAIFFSAGSHFATNALNSLKTALKTELAIDNTQYGAAQAALYLMNTLIPVMGGLMIDHFGTIKGSFVSSTLVLGGNILLLISAYVRSYGLLVAGRVMHGFGSSIIIVAQQTILGRWFRGSALATALGIQTASTNLFAYIAQVSMVPLKDSGWWGNGFWLSVSICFVSWLTVLIYGFVLYRSGGEQIGNRPKRPLSLRDIVHLPAAFWWIPLIIFFFGGSTSPFLGSVIEFVGKRYGMKEQVASVNGSVSLIVPIVLSPLMGGFLDRFGHRTTMVIFASFLLILNYALLGYSWAHPVAPLVLFSIANAVGPVAYNSAVALILHPDLVGTGCGLVRAAFSVSVSMVHLLTGNLQDAYGGSYDGVMIMFLILSILTTLVAIGFALYDRAYYFGMLNASVARRLRIIDTKRDQLPNTSSAKSKVPLRSYIICGIFLIFVLVAWAWFIWSLVENPTKTFARYKFN